MLKQAGMLFLALMLGCAGHVIAHVEDPVTMVTAPPKVSPDPGFEVYRQAGSSLHVNISHGSADLMVNVRNVGYLDRSTVPSTFVMLDDLPSLESMRLRPIRHADGSYEISVYSQQYPLYFEVEVQPFFIDSEGQRWEGVKSTYRFCVLD